MHACGHGITARRRRRSLLFSGLVGALTCMSVGGVIEPAAAASVPARDAHAGSVGGLETLMDLLGMICWFLGCDYGEPMQPAPDVTDKAVSAEIRGQIDFYYAHGIPPLNLAERIVAISYVETTLAFVLTNRGLVDESLEEEYIAVLREMLDELH